MTASGLVASGSSNVARPVWVTGAGGFIGAHLCNVLRARGEKVVAFGRHEVAGALSAQSLEAAIKAEGVPRAVHHLAGGASVGLSLADPLVDFERSVASAAIVLDVVRRHAPDASVLLASSAAVYGAGHEGPIACGATLRPFSPYGHHKRMVEQLAQSFAESYGLRVRAVRLFSVYGEGLRKQLLFDLCRRLGQGEQDIVLGGTGRELRDWCHVDDVAAMLPRLLDKAGPGFSVVNGGGGAVACVGEVAEQVVTAWGGAQRIRFSGISRAGDPFSLVAAPDPEERSAAARVPLADGIGRYVRWFKDTFGTVPA